jgi:hypothetical protein
VAKQISELHRYAVIGAEQRLLQISAEAQAIYRTFPELRRKGPGIRTVADGRHTQSPGTGGGEQVPWPFSDGVRPRGKRGPGRPRKRRTMSADARRRISEAQKARWAKQKAQGGGKKK